MIIHRKKRIEKRNTEREPRYHLQRWKGPNGTRLRILARDYYLCKCDDCKKLAIPMLAPKIGGVVDHIKPVSQGGAFWDEDNLQAMNQSCHQRKSAKERIR